MGKLDTIHAFALDDLNSDSWVATEKTCDKYQHYISQIKAEIQSYSSHLLPQTTHIIHTFNPSVTNLIDIVMKIQPDNYSESEGDRNSELITMRREIKAVSASLKTDSSLQLLPHVSERLKDTNRDLISMRREIEEISTSLQTDSSLNMLQDFADRLRLFSQGLANIKANDISEKFMVVIGAQNKEMEDTNLSDIDLLVPLNQAMLSDFLTIMSDALKEIKRIGKSSSSQKYEENVAKLTSDGQKAVSRPIHRFVILSN